MPSLTENPPRAGFPYLDAGKIISESSYGRDCDSIPGMPPGYIRVQARPEADAARLLETLDGLSLETL